MSYTERFGTGTIQATQVSYLALNPTGDVTLEWPKETAPSPNLLATIIDVTAATPVNITLPDATQGSTGAEFLINNLGAAAVTFLNAGGLVVLVLPAGQAWVTYLADNSTANGAWRTFQLGAATSQAQAANLAGTGLVAIGNTLAWDVPTSSFSSSGMNFALSDRARAYRWTGGAGSCNLPSSGTVPVGWNMRLRNDGTGTLTVNPTGGDTLNGSASLNLQQGQSCLIVCAAAGIMETYGLSGTTTAAFDYTTINVAGTGSYTLSGAELNRIAYKFTGLLTGDRTIIVPATVQQYWVTNATTGAFNFYVKTAAQAAPGVLVAQNQASILYSNSNDVVNADTASGGVSVPVSIAQGGTGATTAAGARTNLGSTSVGDAVFIAVTAAAARAALDAASLTQSNTFTNTNSFSNTVTLTGALNTSGVNTFSSTAAGAGINPVLTLDRNKGANLANDFLGQLKLSGRNSVNAFMEFGSVAAQVLDPTSGSEDGRLVFFTPVAGASTARAYVGAGLYTAGAAGGDLGVNTVNATSLAEAGVLLTAKYLAVGLLTTNGDLIYRNAGVPARLGIGTVGQVLTVSGGLPAWAAGGGGGLAAATQAEMEAASVNTSAATPGRTQFHPGVAKFVCSLNGNTGAIVGGSYNTTGTSRTSQGLYVVTVGTDFSSANWTPQVTAELNSATPVAINIISKTAGTITIQTRNSTGGATLDVDFLHVSGHGDQ